MAIRFFLPERADESIAFAYSPVVEAVLSLHVLVEPKHHPLQHAWVRRMRSLDPSLRAEIRVFTFAYANSFPDFVSPRPDRDYLSFEDELEALHDLDPTLLAFEFLRPIWDHEGRWPRDGTLLERTDVRKQALRSAEYHGRAGASSPNSSSRTLRSSRGDFASCSGATGTPRSPRSGSGSNRDSRTRSRTRDARSPSTASSPCSPGCVLGSSSSRRSGSPVSSPRTSTTWRSRRRSRCS